MAPIPVETSYFNPRSPWGERQKLVKLIPGRSVFQSTLPVGGATENTQSAWAPTTISIHAPRGGSDYLLGQSLQQVIIFQSTLPVGGATKIGADTGTVGKISIHAPRGGSDHKDKPM